MILSWLACNHAPLDYRAVGRAPGGEADWMAPSDWCEEFAQEDPATWQVIDGYTLCATEGQIPIVPVDDPIMVPCSDDVLADVDPQQEVMWVYDGVEARAYALPPLVGREGVHDTLAGVPVFVDW